MVRIRRLVSWSAATALGGILAAGELFAQSPTVADALRLMPSQKADVEIDQPAAADVANCKIEALADGAGWIIRGPNGQVIREFMDTNKNRVVDRWSYYKDGIEVYRDIDENHDGRPDQYRWLNTAGIRWGIDKNQDGAVDEWKTISPEEVTAEVVAALRTRDEARFKRLLLTPGELTGLGLGSEKAKLLAAKLADAPATFGKLMTSQKLVSDATAWVDFGGMRPGVVPAGTADATRDLTAYENVVSMIETTGKPGQLPIGTLVKVGEVWRLIDSPAAEAQQIAAGFFFNNPQRNLAGPEAALGAPSAELQKLIETAQKLDTALAQATSPAEQAKLAGQRADVLKQIAEKAEGTDRALWYKQLAEALSSSVQAGQYPAGLERLNALADELAKADDADTAAFVKYRAMQAAYTTALQESNPDYPKIQAAWLVQLEAFATDYPKSEDAAEALLQLGNAEEFAGQDEKAKAWYKRLTVDFPSAPGSKKARGALTRLESVGQTISLTGKPLGTNAKLDLAAYKGRITLIHYWATWCEPCKVDMAQLKELQTKYGKQGFELIGVNLDEKSDTAIEFLTKNRLPWPQLHEPGGLESRYANELGIMNLPTMILLDETGKVVNRGIHITELENELRKRVKAETATNAPATNPKGKATK